MKNFIIVNRNNKLNIEFFIKNFKINNLVIPQFGKVNEAKKFNSKQEAEEVLNKIPKNISKDLIIL
tara:strand:+ start:280 stop:477 length:198 start_codon:yes stop_codon:yes gene_type:complete